MTKSVNNKKNNKIQDEESSTNKKPVMVSFLALFQFADIWDYLFMTGGTLAAIGFGVIQPLLAILLGDVMNDLVAYAARLKTDVQDSIYNSIYLFLGLGAAAFVAAWIQQAFWIVAGERQARRVRRLFLESILRQDIAFFDDNEVGDLTTRLSSDTTLYQEGVSEKVAMVVVAVSTFLAAFTIAFVKGWKLTLVMLSTLPIMGVAGVIVGTAFSEGTQMSQQAYGKAGAVAQEALANIRTLFAFNGQEKARVKFDGLLVDAQRVNERKYWKTATGFGMFFGMLFGMYALAFYYGSILVSQGEMDGGNILTCIFAIIIGAFSTINLAPALQAVNKGRGAAVKLFQVIHQEPIIPSHKATGKKLEKLTGKIEFRNVTFAYPKRPDVQVLKNFSLTVQPGEKVALVGFSGSGKSTIIQLLERFYDPVEGSILVDDVPIQELNVQWLRQSLGLVSQEPILFDATIEENIRYGALDGVTVTMEDIEKAARLSNAHDFISKLPKKYATLSGERGSQLSGGQKQRVALARAMIKNPQILLLDEATSALDTESERIVQKAIDEVSQNRTTITIAHRLSTIKDANLIVVMDSGNVIETGTHADLLAKGGHYANLVRAQEMKKAQITSVSDPAAASSVAVTKLDSEVAVAVKTEESKKEGIEEELTKEEREKREMERLLKENKKPIMRVLRMQKPELLYIVIGCTVSLLNGAILPLFGVLFGEVLGIFRKPTEEMLADARFWSLIFFILMFVDFFVNLLQIGCFGVAGERLTRRVRSSYFQAMLRQEAAFFDKPTNGTGALTSRLSEEAERIQGLTGPTMGNIIQLLSSMTVALALAFYYSWQMTLVVLGAFPLIGLGGIIEAKATFGALGNPQVRKAYAEASQSSCDAIANIRTVKSLTVESRFVNTYMEQILIPYQLGLKRAGIGSAAFGLSQGLQFWIYAIAFFAGYKFAELGYFRTPTDIFTVLFSILFGAIALSQAATFGPNLSKAAVAAINYFELVDRQPSIDGTTEKGEKPVDVTGCASLEKCEFTYPQRPDVPILKGVSLSVLAGKTVALVGPSGSGKSTVVALLERFYDPNAGRALVEKIDVKEWNLRYLRENMSIVSQEPSLFIGTIAENISYGKPGATQEQIEEAARMANIHDFIQSLPDQYKTEISNSQLSGGQKQRVAIARALLLKPRILLLDEATSALDSESEKVVQEALNKASEGRTTITIAHRLSTIQNADWIIVMKDGVIMEEGKHDDLLKNQGLYSALVAKQQLG